MLSATLMWPVSCVIRYMIVGFEVVPCSIHRNPGSRLEDIPCPMSPDDPDAPKPMEVTKGALTRV